MTHSTHLTLLTHFTHLTHLTHSQNNGIQESGKFSTFSQNESGSSECSESVGYIHIFHNWINLLLKEDSNLLGRSGNGQWCPLGDFKLPQHRTLCSNEFAFDIDAQAWEPCLNMARQFETVMNNLNIPFLRFTSGNWLHYHVFFDKSVSIDFDMVKEYYEPIYSRITTQLMQEFLRELRHGIFKFITDYVKKIKGAEFDKNVFFASRHMIRIEGTRNEKTGFFKSVLDELPEEQPKVTKENVKFPERIEYWKINEDLIEYVYKFYVKKPKPIIYSEYSGTPKVFDWIEKLHDKPLSDGRHRVTDLILIPYSKQILKLDAEQTLTWIRNWLDKSYELSPPHGGRRIMDSYILNKFRASNISPLSKKNLQNHFSDVKEIMGMVE